jgi:signal transduction histidine kinase
VKLKFENCISMEKEARDPSLPELRKDFVRIIEEVRKVSYDLAPSGITEFGLDASLKMLCSEIRKHSCIHTEFTSFGNFDALPSKTRNYLFRIAQETLNNAVKHSGASKIYLHLTESAENVVLMTEDNGSGFDPGKAAGTGLQNMRERARLLGGTFDLEAVPGTGTTIRVKVPKILKNQN